MMLNIINEIGNKKLDMKSTICASSLGVEGTDGGGGGAIGAGADAMGDGATGGVDCCEAADIDTAESMCSELLLCLIRLNEFE
jgi:hypothetical protein